MLIEPSQRSVTILCSEPYLMRAPVTTKRAAPSECAMRVARRTPHAVSKERADEMECTAFEGASRKIRKRAAVEERVDEKERTVPQRSEPQLTKAPETSERDDDGDDGVGVAAVVLDEATRHEASRGERRYRDLRATRSPRTETCTPIEPLEVRAPQAMERVVRSRTQTQRSRALIEPKIRIETSMLSELKTLIEHRIPRTSLREEHPVIDERAALNESAVQS